MCAHLQHSTLGLKSVTVQISFPGVMQKASLKTHWHLKKLANKQMMQLDGFK